MQQKIIDVLDTADGVHIVDVYKRQVILTGGIVTRASASIEGLLGADLLQKIHTDIALSLIHISVPWFIT